MAMPATRDEERDKNEKASEIPSNRAASWNTISFNEFIAAIIITKGLVFIHAVTGCQLA